MKQNVYFVSGIDTDAGKSYATGFLAREWNKNGQRTITQKFIQTGNVGHSEDIDLHRHINPLYRRRQGRTHYAGNILLSCLSTPRFPTG